jgi:putative ABC transport system ATP-binding protein
MAIITMRSVKKEYELGKTRVAALKRINIEIREGDFISIAGPSGSGKSTLLNLIGCIDVPTEGSISIRGEDTRGLSDRKLTTLRHETLGFIFQSFNLIPVLNVFENIELPLLLDGKGVKARASRAQINSLIDEVGLSDWIRHKPNELSGGQRQRVAIARALVTRPAIVLADEPTANLDSETGKSIIALMKRMNKQHGTTFVFSTHDPTIVGIADHVIRLKDGLVVEESRKEENGHGA